MSKYHCLECDAEFDEPAEWEEYRGECFGVPAYEPVDGCPYCHGEYLSEEDYKRDILGENDEDEEDEDEVECEDGEDEHYASLGVFDQEAAKILFPNNEEVK